MPRLSFSPSLSEDPDLPEFSRRHQKRHGHLDVQSQISHMLADESEDRLRRRRDCYDWVSSEEGKTSETGRSAELAFVQRDWS